MDASECVSRCALQCAILSPTFKVRELGSRKEWLLSKFVENEFEKVDGLMELYIRYVDRVKVEIERMDQRQLDDVELDDEE